MGNYVSRFRFRVFDARFLDGFAAFLLGDSDVFLEAFAFFFTSRVVLEAAAALRFVLTFRRIFAREPLPRLGIRTCSAA